MRVTTHGRTALAVAIALAAALAAGCQVIRDIGEVAEDTGESIADTETWQSIESNWDQFAAAAAERWNALTQDDMDGLDGDRDSLIEEVSEAYDISRDEAAEQVDDWARTLGT